MLRRLRNAVDGLQVGGPSEWCSRLFGDRPFVQDVLVVVRDTEAMSTDHITNTPHNLPTNPIHLGLGAAAVVEPVFTGDMAWYGAYTERHAGDGIEARLVSMSETHGAWDMWEMHPNGAEVVVCTAGTLSLTQELADGEVTTVLQAGDYVINPPGVWHTANEESAGTAVFITAGVGTEHRARVAP